MLQKPVVRLRNLKELQSSQKLKAENEEFVTPLKKVKKPRSKRVTVTKDQSPAAAVADIPAAVVSTTKRVSKSARKEPPPSQLRIDSFFKTAVKSFKVDIEDPPTPFPRKAATDIKVDKEKAKAAGTIKKSPRKKGRKRLFADEMSTSSDDGSASPLRAKYTLRQKDKTILRTNNNINKIANECITVSDSDEERGEEGGDIKTNVEKMSNERLSQRHIERNSIEDKPLIAGKSSSSAKSPTTSRKENSPLTSSSKRVTSNSSTTNSHMALDSGTSKPLSSTTKRKQKACPPYKIIEGTTFAVDGFQYGCIEGVTHYFLTHFHADHYIGLTKKFAMPLYMSSITARLVRAFIPLDEQYIHELELNSPQIVNDIEITALDANHCPGAVMLLFKFPNTGKCILHTGDFRAWHGMESEPDFWNNDITTIYLDTTYISHKYEFCTQYESIVKAKDLMQKFRDKHADKRILYICGSYVIGKEKFWSALAEEFQLKVWTEENRSKALKAMEDKDLNKLLIDDPLMADMHVITMGKISYLSLVEYFAKYEHQYDILLAIRPSGWEKDSRPQYRGKINIIGIEYSEHSSYGEMQRFVKFLKPLNVISTVPTGRDLMKTAKVPEKWYKYENLHSSSNYQPCIEQFLSKTPQRKSYIHYTNANNGDLDTFVSPLSKKHLPYVHEINNNDTETVVSIVSSKNEFEQPPTKKVEETLQSSQTLRNSKKREANVKASSKLKKNGEILNSEKKIKAEKLERSQKSKNLSGIVPSTQKSTNRAAVRQRTPTPIKNKSNTPNNNDSELILTQSLKAGESCSIFISKSNETQPPSSTGSSDYFAMPLLKNRKRVTPTTAANDVLPFSQKRNTRAGNRKAKMPHDTLENDEPESASDTGKTQIHMVSIPTELLTVYKTEDPNGDAFLRDTPTTSQMAYKNNPLLKSNTNSYASSVNEEVPFSQTSDDFEKTPRPLRDRVKHMYDTEKDIIPASQTSKDLENTPRPLRNKIRHSQHVQASLSTNAKRQNKIVSQASKDKPPLRNKIPDPPDVMDFFLENDVIPASQTSNDLEKTPRPLRNKRNKSMPLSVAASPSKKSKESSSADNSDNTSPDILTQILKTNEMLDFYNTSQLTGIVVDTLAEQQPDKSVDHIPQDLLSDADDDWLD